MGALRTRCLLWLLPWLLAAGCSLRSLGIKFADRVAVHELDAYFDLSAEQERVFVPLVKQHVAWMKSQLFPKVICDMTVFSRAIARGLTAADVERALSASDEWRMTMASHLAPDTGRFLATLSPEQVQHFAAKLAKSNSDSERLEKLNDEDFVEARRDELLTLAGTWLGKLNDEQEALLVRKLLRDRAHWRLRYGQRRFVQSRLVELAGNGRSVSETVARLLSWTRSPHLMRGGTAADAKERRAEYIGFILGLYAVADPEQRRHAQLTLEDLLTDLAAGQRPACG